MLAMEDGGHINMKHPFVSWGPGACLNIKTRNPSMESFSMWLPKLTRGCLCIEMTVHCFIAPYTLLLPQYNCIHNEMYIGLHNDSINELMNQSMCSICIGIGSKNVSIQVLNWGYWSVPLNYMNICTCVQGSMGGYVCHYNIDLMRFIGGIKKAHGGELWLTCKCNKW